ncbi:hypothetical protein AAFF_G00327750 [Aldrovandia affinis]|uniref:Uncharacterized protein n=1 Tax=Aldrovandia affinis TaxID=143900 RepID=A0AAD7T9L9_9TELE|nr:hypothetical protein AAFF_G00327750 [Aldrovandia affinis]
MPPARVRYSSPAVNPSSAEAGQETQGDNGRAGKTALCDPVTPQCYRWLLGLGAWAWSSARRSGAWARGQQLSGRARRRQDRANIPLLTGNA